MGLLTQWRWRVIGGICLAGAGLMAWMGVKIEFVHSSHWLFLGYWGVFAILFLTTIYCVILDLRYIRVQSTLAEREVFRQTLGDEEFRRALRAAQEAAAKHGDDGRTKR